MTWSHKKATGGSFSPKLRCWSTRFHCLLAPAIWLSHSGEKEEQRDEKVIERAYKKLALDALVIQQGRLAEQKTVNKDELLQMVRFGAEMVFSSKDSTITDEDIDRIIAQGEEAELDAKMKKFAEDAIKFKMDDTADLYDFDDEKMDPNTGVAMYESDDIIKYLVGKYGDGNIPFMLSLGQLTTLTEGFAMIGRMGKGSSYTPSKLPPKPLELWAFEVRL